MEYRRLGRTGLRVSPLCLGTAFRGQKDDSVCIRTIQRALDLGCNFIDTANGYGRGRSETLVGQALEGRRHQVVLTMIIQNRAKAGFFLVRSCAARHEFTENAKRPKWNLGLMAAGLLVFLVIMYIGLVVGKVVAPPFGKGEKAMSAVEPQPKMLGQLVI